jgi:hypothetical protein
MIIRGYAVKTLESKETKASREMTVTHNSVFAAHRLQCRMTIRKIAIRHFAFHLHDYCRGHASFEVNSRNIYGSLQLCPAGKLRFPTSVGVFLHLFFQPRHVPGSKLPPVIALNQGVRKLYNAIERLAFRCSFHARFSQNNRHIVAVQSR